MGLRDAPDHAHMRTVVGVVDVHHRAHQHRRRQVAAPAAVGDQVHAIACSRPSLVEADLEAGEERMALAGQLHVERCACSLIAHRAAGAPGRQRRQRGEGIGLGFLAAEAAAHAQAAADHAVRGMPSTCATIAWVSLGCWVDAVTCTTPSLSISTQLAWVSR
jgi:hypothetical protein